MSAGSAKSDQNDVVPRARAGARARRAARAWRLRGGERQHDLDVLDDGDAGRDSNRGVVTTFRLGAIWQHGEILLAYRTEDGGEIHLDLFDRVGKASTSTMKLCPS